MNITNSLQTFFLGVRWITCVHMWPLPSSSKRSSMFTRKTFILFLHAYTKLTDTMPVHESVSDQMSFLLLRIRPASFRTHRRVEYNFLGRTKNIWLSKLIYAEIAQLQVYIKGLRNIFVYCSKGLRNQLSPVHSMSFSVECLFIHSHQIQMALSCSV